MRALLSLGLKGIDHTHPTSPEIRDIPGRHDEVVGSGRRCNHGIHQSNCETTGKNLLPQLAPLVPFAALQ
jgi:hypothetical protein